MLNGHIKGIWQYIRSHNRQVFYFALACIVLAADLSLGAALNRQPSNERLWKTEHNRLASVEFDGEKVIVKGVRNFSYDETGAIKNAKYETRIYDLTQLKSLWFGVQPFLADILGHSFLSFEFEDDVFLVLSVEARQETGEAYSVLGGLMGEFELIYVWADERDVIGLRSHILDLDVHLYQIEAPLPDIRSYLIRQLMRTNDLVVNPQFYNTLTQNCTTSLFEMSNVPALKRYSDYRVLFPGYAHRLLQELNVIDNSVSAEEVYERARVENKGDSVDNPQFSMTIRQRTTQWPANSD